MRIKINNEKVFEASSAEIIALDDSWCIKFNTCFDIDGKHKFFLQLPHTSDKTARDIKQLYAEILNEAFEKDMLDCGKASLELVDVIEDDDDDNDGETVLAALILRTEEILTKEFFNTLDQCTKLEKGNKPLQLINEIGALRGLKYSLATCNINLDEKAEKKFQKYIKLQNQLINVEK